MSEVLRQMRGCPALQGDLPHLGQWRVEERFAGVDLGLSDRTRVSSFPWRGQFSPETVDRLLMHLGLSDGVTLLDPFVGSGTALVEAARRGYPALGFDVNPAAIALARAAEWAGLQLRARDRLVARLGRRATWLAERAEPAEAVSRLKGLTDTHTLALLAHLSGGLSRRGLTVAIERIRRFVAALPPEPVPVKVAVGDARATELQDGVCGVVLTSPPYINVFNYHQFGRPLTDVFGWDVLTAARSEVGSNRQNRGNRFRTVVSYAMDMALALKEMCRVLAPGGTAVLIVGRESRVRGVQFFNGDILASIAAQLGSFDALTRAERVFTNRYGELIFEDVLVLSGSRPIAVDDVAVLDLARNVGAAALACARSADRPVQEEIWAVAADAADLRPTPVAPGGLASRDLIP